MDFRVIVRTGNLASRLLLAQCCIISPSRVEFPSVSFLTFYFKFSLNLPRCFSDSELQSPGEIKINKGYRSLEIVKCLVGVKIVL